MRQIATINPHQPPSHQPIAASSCSFKASPNLQTAITSLLQHDFNPPIAIIWFSIVPTKSQIATTNPHQPTSASFSPRPASHFPNELPSAHIQPPISPIQPRLATIQSLSVFSIPGCTSSINSHLAPSSSQ